MRNGRQNLSLLAVLLLSAASLYGADSFLFAYFKEPAKSGIYYALSTDGYHWRSLNDGNPVFAPQQPKELMRDIFITRGPDRQFHAVWTWGWHEKVIGYAHSPDLVHWSRQIKVPLKIGRNYFIYYDHYRAAPGHEAIRYEGLRPSDLKNWTPIEVSFPKGCKHGSFLKLRRAEAERLEALHTAAMDQ